MRQSKLVVGLMTTVCTVALCSVAAARPVHPGPLPPAKHRGPGPGPCGVSINVAPGVITAGDPVVVWGRLTCAPDASQPVNLMAEPFGQTSFTSIGTATTDGSGFYELDLAGGVVDANSELQISTPMATSHTVVVHVAAQITLSGPADGSQLYTGPAHPYTFTGTMTPADAGAVVILQRQNSQTGNDWRHIDQGVIQADGSYSVTHVFKVPGDANIRAVVRSQRRNLASASNVLSYEISQTENPNLTLTATPDPIDFGQSVTLSGTLAAGSGQAVNLVARDIHHPGYMVVAQVMTGAGGTYSFPAQSPVYSTFYRVRAADGTNSAVLFEGVRDVLTAMAAPTTVMAGQTVTFSGTVMPDHTGHAIYLERQDLNSPLFHVVQVAIVGPGSAYSIVHRFYATGSKVFRVFIPGGPEDQGAASQPFTITVTSAPVSTLPPDTPGNSSLPPGGQQ